MSFIAFPLDLPHNFPDSRRIVTQKRAELQVQTVEFMFDAVKSLLHAVKP
jgi:hypothetical protein